MPCRSVWMSVLPRSLSRIQHLAVAPVQRPCSVKRNAFCSVLRPLHTPEFCLTSSVLSSVPWIHRSPCLPPRPHRAHPVQVIQRKATQETKRNGTQLLPAHACHQLIPPAFVVSCFSFLVQVVRFSFFVSSFSFWVPYLLSLQFMQCVG